MITEEGVLLALSAMLIAAALCGWVVGSVLLVTSGNLPAQVVGVGLLVTLAVGFFMFAAWALSQV